MAEIVDSTKLETIKPEITKTEELPAEKQLHDLGVLTSKSKLFISTIPKDTQAVVVKYSPGIRISCVIPPQKLSVRIFDDQDYDRIRKCKVSTPTILMSIRYADIPIYGHVEVVDVSIFAIDTKIQNRIRLTPYLFSNVYSSGVVCWGSAGKPWDLKSAFNTYWNTNFNGELLGEGDDYDSYDAMDYIKKYRNKILKHQKYTDQTSFVCGEKFWAAPKGAAGVLITSNDYLLKQIPSKYYLRVPDEQPKVCLLANKTGDLWTFESGSYKFSISADSISLQPFYNKKLADIKKKHLQTK